jgi:hypothetical protein
MTDRSMKAILLDGESRAPESRRLTLVREKEEAGAAVSPSPTNKARTLTFSDAFTRMPAVPWQVRFRRTFDGVC